MTDPGYKYDPERLKEEVAFTKRLNTLLDEVDSYKRARLSPWHRIASGRRPSSALEVA